jgi:hypothetical protein
MVSSWVRYVCSWLDSVLNAYAAGWWFPPKSCNRIKSMEAKQAKFTRLTYKKKTVMWRTGGSKIARFRLLKTLCCWPQINLTFFFHRTLIMYIQMYIHTYIHTYMHTSFRRSTNSVIQPSDMKPVRKKNHITHKQNNQTQYNTINKCRYYSLQNRILYIM